MDLSSGWFAVILLWFGLLRGVTVHGVMWIQPGMNHVVACCDVVSFNATKLEVENHQLVRKSTTLRETLVSDLSDYQPPNLEVDDSSTLTLPPGSAVLPLVPSLNFRAHHWYDVCFKRTNRETGSLESVCFPVRPCNGCQCDSTTTDSESGSAGGGWLRILVNVTSKEDEPEIKIRLLSTFSSDSPTAALRVRYNLNIQSEKYYSLCNKPPAIDQEADRSLHQMHARECNRLPRPILQDAVHPSEAVHLQPKQVGGRRRPFYVLITVNLTASRSIWPRRDIVHHLEPILVEDEDGDGAFAKWIHVPVPTPRFEEDHRPILDWDEEDAKRICPAIQQIDCQKRDDCASGTGARSVPSLLLVLLILISSSLRGVYSQF